MAASLRQQPGAAPTSSLECREHSGNCRHFGNHFFRNYASWRPRSLWPQPSAADPHAALRDELSASKEMLAKAREAEDMAAKQRDEARQSARDNEVQWKVALRDELKASKDMLSVAREAQTVRAQVIDETPRSTLRSKPAAQPAQHVKRRASSSSSLSSAPPKRENRFLDLDAKVDSIAECYRQLVIVVNGVCEQVSDLVISLRHEPAKSAEVLESRFQTEPHKREMAARTVEKPESPEQYFIGDGVVSQLLADAEAMAQISSCKAFQMDVAQSMSDMSRRVDSLEREILLTQEADICSEVSRLSDELRAVVRDVSSLRVDVGELSREKQSLNPIQEEVERHVVDLSERVSSLEMDLAGEMESMEDIMRRLQDFSDAQGAATEFDFEEVAARLDRLEDRLPETLAQVAQDLETKVERLCVDPQIQSSLRAAAGLPTVMNKSESRNRFPSLSDSMSHHRSPSTDVSHACSPGIATARRGPGVDELLVRVQQLELQLSVQAKRDAEEHAALRNSLACDAAVRRSRSEVAEVAAKTMFLKGQDPQTPSRRQVTEDLRSPWGRLPEPQATPDQVDVKPTCAEQTPAPPQREQMRRLALEGLQEALTEHKAAPTEHKAHGELQHKPYDARGHAAARPTPRAPPSPASTPMLVVQGIPGVRRADRPTRICGSQSPAKLSSRSELLAPSESGSFVSGLPAPPGELHPN